MDKPPLSAEQSNCAVQEYRGPTVAHFRFLDRLRESGVTNMWGANPFIEKRFGLSSDRASKILMAWIETFDGKTSVEDRAAKATGAKP